MEFSAIDAIKNIDGFKDYAKAHARSDWQRHGEVMEVLQPISDALRTATGIKKTFMAVILALSLIFGTIYAAVQAFGVKH